MGLDIIMSPTRNRDYHLLTEEGLGIFERFVGEMFDSYASYELNSLGTSIIYVVKRQGAECLAGAFINVTKACGAGKLDMRFAYRLRGGKDYPVLAFVGWRLNEKSKEVLSGNYVSMSEEFFLSLLKHHYELCWDETLGDNRGASPCANLPLPIINDTKREFFTYPNAFVESMLENKGMYIPLERSYENLLFNQALNFALSATQDVSFCIGLSDEFAKSAKQGLTFTTFANDKAKFDLYNAAPIKPNTQRLVYSAFANSGINIDITTQQAILRAARNNTSKYYFLLKRIVEIAAKCSIRIITLPLVFKILSDLSVFEDGLNANDLMLLNTIKESKQISNKNLADICFLPFLIRERYVQVDRSGLSLTQKGFDIVNYFITGGKA